MFNVKSWLVPYLKKLQHITSPLHYKVKGIEKNVKLYYKSSYHNDIWKELEFPILQETLGSSPALVIKDFK